MSGSPCSGSSDEFSVCLARQRPEPTFEEEEEDETDGQIQLTTGSSTVDNITPLTGFSSGQPPWNSQMLPRPRGGSSGEILDPPRTAALNGATSPRPQRPTAPARTPSNTYNPPRKPSQLMSLHSNQPRSFSSTRPRRDPNAQYRAQEKAYIEQLRQDPHNGYFSEEPFTPSLSYSTDSETEEESPSSEVHFDSDIYDPDTQLFYNNDELRPSSEELHVPENRERLEWH